jgi:hypothetical protein
MGMMVLSLAGHGTLTDSLKKQRKLCCRTTHYHCGPVQGNVHPQSFHSSTSLGCTHQLLPRQSSLYLLIYTHYILKLNFVCVPGTHQFHHGCAHCLASPLPFASYPSCPCLSNIHIFLGPLKPLSLRQQTPLKCQ